MMSDLDDSFKKYLKIINTISYNENNNEYITLNHNFISAATFLPLLNYIKQNKINLKFTNPKVEEY